MPIKKKYTVLTKRQLELLQVVKGENDCCSLPMAAYLMGTTPQAVGRIVMALSSKGLVYRTSTGYIYRDTRHSSQTSL